MEKILQSWLPITPWSDPKLVRLPGVMPLDPSDWLIVDDAYGGQMALREHLLKERRDDVLCLHPGSLDAAHEALSLVLQSIAALPGFSMGADQVICPDDRRVRIDRDDPMATIGRLVQEDVCVLQKRDGEHVLTGAVLCFPASWALSEKFMKPLIGIHRVVKPYDEKIAPRVQRLFDGIQPGRPMWRANAHFYDNPDLYAPRFESDPRKSQICPAPYVRSERQCLVRLPETQAVVFSIHTYMVARENLTPAQNESLVGGPALVQERI